MTLISISSVEILAFTSCQICVVLMLGWRKASWMSWMAAPRLRRSALTVCRSEWTAGETRVAHPENRM